MTSRTFLQHHQKHLSDYEKSEVQDYENVYYYNLMKEPKAVSPKQENNYGFDNDANEYICEQGDHISYRYEILSALGKGSFG